MGLHENMNCTFPLKVAWLVSMIFNIVWKAQESCSWNGYLVEHYQVVIEAVKVGLINDTNDVSCKNLI